MILLFALPTFILLSAIIWFRHITRDERKEIRKWEKDHEDFVPNNWKNFKNYK